MMTMMMIMMVVVVGMMVDQVARQQLGEVPVSHAAAVRRKQLAERSNRLLRPVLLHKRHRHDNDDGLRWQASRRSGGIGMDWLVSYCGLGLGSLLGGKRFGMTRESLAGAAGGRFPGTIKDATRRYVHVISRAS